MKPSNHMPRPPRLIREVVYLRHDTHQGLLTLLAMYHRIESKSRLMETALVWYLESAMRFGLNADWHPEIPGQASREERAEHRTASPPQPPGHGKHA